MAKPKIYIFRNSNGAPIEASNIFVAAAEDGYTLAMLLLRPEEFPLVRLRFGPFGRFAKKYSAYYPDGYELVFIENILAAEHWQLRETLAKAALKRAKQREAEIAIAKDIERKLTKAVQDSAMANVARN